MELWMSLPKECDNRVNIASQSGSKHFCHYKCLRNITDIDKSYMHNYNDSEVKLKLHYSNMLV